MSKCPQLSILRQIECHKRFLGEFHYQIKNKKFDHPLGPLTIKIFPGIILFKKTSAIKYTKWTHNPGYGPSRGVQFMEQGVISDFDRLRIWIIKNYHKDDTQQVNISPPFSHRSLFPVIHQSNRFPYLFSLISLRRQCEAGRTWWNG